jgi:hypothetical protein
MRTDKLVLTKQMVTDAASLSRHSKDRLVVSMLAAMSILTDLGVDFDCDPELQQIFNVAYLRGRMNEMNEERAVYD